jgi:hypothetical protein
MKIVLFYIFRPIFWINSNGFDVYILSIIVEVLDGFEWQFPCQVPHNLKIM